MSILAVVKKLFSLIFSILGLVRRCMNKIICRARRLRRDSGTVLPFTTDQISSTDIPQSVPSNELEFEPWDSWGGETQTGGGDGETNHRSHTGLYSSKVEEYRQKQMQLRQQQELAEPEADYFNDMKPQFHKAKKVLVRGRGEEKVGANASNKFAMNSYIPTATSELESWEETGSGWEADAEDDLAWEADAVIREKKRQEREQRQAEQQRKKQEREATRGMRKDSFNAVRLS